eukprot:353962_1
MRDNQILFVIESQNAHGHHETEHVQHKREVEQHHKIEVVSHSHALADPRTVMIELHNAMVAAGTMFRSWRTVYSARRTEPISDTEFMQVGRPFRQIHLTGGNHARVLKRRAPHK